MNKFDIEGLCEQGLNSGEANFYEAALQDILVLVRSAPENAQHIFNWARNSEPNCYAMRAARAYPEGENFSASRAYGVFEVARKTYREMKPDRQGESYSAADILAAAILMLEWDGEE